MCNYKGGAIMEAMSKERLDSVLENRMEKLIEAIKGRHYDDPMAEAEYQRKVAQKMHNLIDGYKLCVSVCEDL